MDWLRRHMRDQISNFSAVDAAENVLNFPRSPYSANSAGVAALDLVYQAAELIKKVEDQAAERQVRAETLTKRAIEDLEIAVDRVQSAESQRHAAEARIKEVSVKLREAEEALERTTSRMTAAEAQVSVAEQRVRIAEMRATEAENALRRIEQAIRSRILERTPGDSSRAAAAA